MERNDLEIIEIDLADLAALERLAVRERTTYAIVSLHDDLLGACVLPPVNGFDQLLRALANALGDAVRERAVADAIGRAEGWCVPGADGPPVTVVVCTVDRPVTLGRCLSGLSCQLGDEDELIVVDNSASGSARTVAEQGSARWVHERRPGSSWARNRGAAEAAHEVVAYIDDDCVPDRAWLEAIRRPFVDEDVDVVTGGVLGRRIDLLVPWYVDRRYPFHRGWRPARRRGTTGGPSSPYDPWRLGTGASMAWRRQLFDRLGGFDPALGAGTRTGGVDELDLFRRAVVSGANIAYRPDALVFHDHPETLRDLRRMLLRYSVGEGSHLAKMVFEEGRPRPLVVALDDYRWRLAAVPRDVRAAVSRSARIPLLATAAHLPAMAIGAARFLHERALLRGAS